MLGPPLTRRSRTGGRRPAASSEPQYARCALARGGGRRACAVGRARRGDGGVTTRRRGHACAGCGARLPGLRRLSAGPARLAGHASHLPVLCGSPTPGSWRRRPRSPVSWPDRRPTWALWISAIGCASSAPPRPWSCSASGGARRLLPRESRSWAAPRPGRGCRRIWRGRPGMRMSWPAASGSGVTMTRCLSSAGSGRCGRRRAGAHRPRRARWRRRASAAVRRAHGHVPGPSDADYRGVGFLRGCLRSCAGWGDQCGLVRASCRRPRAPPVAGGQACAGRGARGTWSSSASDH
jgi:hypothetical protein